MTQYILVLRVRVTLSYLPNTAERIQSGFAEVRVVPVIEEMVGLLSSSQLLGLQPFLPPLPV